MPEPLGHNRPAAIRGDSPGPNDDTTKSALNPNREHLAGSPEESKLEKTLRERTVGACTNAVSWLVNKTSEWSVNAMLKQAGFKAEGLTPEADRQLLSSLLQVLWSGSGEDIDLKGATLSTAYSGVDIEFGDIQVAKAPATDRRNQGESVVNISFKMKVRAGDQEKTIFCSLPGVTLEGHQSAFYLVSKCFRQMLPTLVNAIQTKMHLADKQLENRGSDKAGSDPESMKKSLSAIFAGQAANEPVSLCLSGLRLGETLEHIMDGSDDHEEEALQFDTLTLSPGRTINLPDQALPVKAGDYKVDVENIRLDGVHDVMVTGKKGSASEVKLGAETVSFDISIDDGISPAVINVSFDGLVAQGQTNLIELATMVAKQTASNLFKSISQRTQAKKDEGAPKRQDKSIVASQNSKLNISAAKAMIVVKKTGDMLKPLQIPSGLSLAIDNPDLTQSLLSDHELSLEKAISSVDFDKARLEGVENLDFKDIGFSSSSGDWEYSISDISALKIKPVELSKSKDKADIREVHAYADKVTCELVVAHRQAGSPVKLKVELIKPRLFGKSNIVQLLKGSVEEFIKQKLSSLVGETGGEGVWINKDIENTDVKLEMDKMKVTVMGEGQLPGVHLKPDSHFSIARPRLEKKNYQLLTQQSDKPGIDLSLRTIRMGDLNFDGNIGLKNCSLDLDENMSGLVHMEVHADLKEMSNLFPQKMLQHLIQGDKGKKQKYIMKLRCNVDKGVVDLDSFYIDQKGSPDKLTKFQSLLYDLMKSRVQSKGTGLKVVEMDNESRGRLPETHRDRAPGSIGTGAESGQKGQKVMLDIHLLGFDPSDAKAKHSGDSALNELKERLGLSKKLPRRGKYTYPLMDWTGKETAFEAQPGSRGKIRLVDFCQFYGVNLGRSL